MSRSAVSFRLADDLKLALKERADTEGISVTELVNRLLRQGLASDEVIISGADRLSSLEDTVQHILKVFELEQRKRESFLRSTLPIEERLIEVEERLRQMTSDFEQRRQKIESLLKEKKEKVDIRERDQGTYQNADSIDSVEVSLKDLCGLLKPPTQLPKLSS